MPHLLLCCKWEVNNAQFFPDKILSSQYHDFWIPHCPATTDYFSSQVVGHYLVDQSTDTIDYSTSRSTILLTDYLDKIANFTVSMQQIVTSRFEDQVISL